MKILCTSSKRLRKGPQRGAKPWPRHCLGSINQRGNQRLIGWSMPHLWDEMVSEP